MPARTTTPSDLETLMFSEHLACTHCGVSFDELAPRNFSFNSPYGACERCDGLGTRFEVDPELRRPRRRPQPRATARSRRGRGSAATTSSACSSRSPTEYGFSLDTPWKKLKKKRQAGRALRHRQDLGEGVVPQPLRAPALVHHAVRRRGAVARAPPHRVGERPRPRADRGLHARGAVPRVRRRAAAAGVARGHHRRHEHLRGRRAVDPQGVGVPRVARAVRTRPHDRRAGREGGQRAAAVPARRRPRLPQPQPLVGHAGRRRGAAHPARVADRQRARRRALRARRAVDRPAPARQPAPDRHAGAPARPRQHRDRRRARRGDHPHRRPRRRHRARARGSTAARSSSRARSRRCWPSKRSITGQYLVGQALDRDARDAARTGRRVDHRARRARAQPPAHRRRLPARVLRRGHRRERQRQEHAGHRHPATRR